MKYCEFCGKQLSDTEKCTCEEAVRKAAKTNKTLKLCAMIGIPVLILVIIIACIVGAVKTDPSSYLSEPVFSGFDTMGTATVTFDEKALIESIIGEEPQESFLSEEYNEWYQKYEAYSAGIQCEYPKEGLSNGDTFVIKILVSGEAADDIKSIEKAYTVNGLTETETVDIMQYIELEFSGISGEADAKVVKTSEDEIVQACQIQIDGAYDRKNGEEITVYIANAEALLEQFNVIPKETEKTFTVSGLGTYATAEDLPMDEIQKLVAQYVAKEQAENDAEGVASFSYSEVKLYGIYFMEEKEDAFMANHNELHILIYYDYYIGGTYDRTNYIPLVFEDIVADTNGKVVLAYEDGKTAYFYTDIDKYMSKHEEKYTIKKIG